MMAEGADLEVGLVPTRGDDPRKGGREAMRGPRQLESARMVIRTRCQNGTSIR
jgi:hypothetical protein